MIPTFTGKCVNPFDLKPGDICIEDIAHHLAQTNRFNGSPKWPISVAQHSVYVARLCEEALVPAGAQGRTINASGIPFPIHGNSDHNKLALQGLLHDAAEAYFGDVTVFLKRQEMFSMYRRAEKFLQIAIFEIFGCSITEAPEVKEADYLMARFEALKAFGPDFHFCGNKIDYPPLIKEEIRRVGRWQPWSWKTSEEVFLSEFRRFNGDY